MKIKKFNNFEYRPIFNKLIEDKINDFPEELINEGLILSTSYENMNNSLNKLFIGKNIKIEISHMGIDLFIKNKVFNKDLYEKFMNLLKVNGYLISYFSFDKYKNVKKFPDETDIFRNDYEIIKFHLIRKFDVENEKGLPIRLYHITESKFVEKILKKGLIPKSQNKIEIHPERIYVIDKLKGAIEFKDILKLRFPDKKYKLLSIDTKLINKIKLYYDPSYFISENDYYHDDYKAFYTYDNIPPFAIKIINGNF